MAQHTTVRCEAINICGHAVELFAFDAAGGQHGIEVDRKGAAAVLVESGAVRVDECAVDDGARGTVVGLEQQPAQPGEQRHVAADADLHEFVGDRDAVPDNPVHLLRILEPDQIPPRAADSPQ